MSLFPERQKAVRVLYKAASQLLDNAGDSECPITRELNRSRVTDCLLLADRIAVMNPVKITVDQRTHDDGTIKVEAVPFDLGFVVVGQPEEPKP